MSCKYKTECPSYSSWCEGPKQDFSKCIPFLVTAYENAKKEVSMNKITHSSICDKSKPLDNLRPCVIDGRRALFHKWFHKSDLHEALFRGEVSGIIECELALVEYENGTVVAVYPSKIKFIDSAELFNQVNWPEETDECQE